MNQSNKQTTKKQRDDSFGSAANGYLLHYSVLLLMAVFEGFVYGPRTGLPVVMLVLVGFIFAVCALVTLIVIFSRYVRRERWIESIQAGFWTGLTWIILLGIYDLIK